MLVPTLIMHDVIQSEFSARPLSLGVTTKQSLRGRRGAVQARRRFAYARCTYFSSINHDVDRHYRHRRHPRI